ncbi:hypothetical protein FO519_008017 [Halicephalobus sp. NKZ332]|nr:hypothetical protein FO519_008017 [Halicephalobus sp. NKZ332]
MIQKIDENHFLGCTHNNVPRITPNYLKYFRNEIDKQINEYSSLFESEFYILPAFESKLKLRWEERIREVICSKLQDTCFNIIDYPTSEDTFIRVLKTELLPTANMSEVAFKRVGDQEVIEEAIVEPLFYKAMLQMPFEFGTFGGLKDFEKGHVLQIGLANVGMNVLFADKFPKTKLTSVEIDPTMKYIAKKWFLVKESDKQKIIIKDEIQFIKKNKKKFDLILLDVCFSSDDHSVCPGPPFLRPSIIKALSNSLTPNGTISINSLYSKSPTMGDNENFIKHFKPHFSQCMMQQVNRNFVSGCSNNNNISRMTKDYLEYRRKMIDKKIKRIIGGTFRFLL